MKTKTLPQRRKDAEKFIISIGESRDAFALLPCHKPRFARLSLQAWMKEHKFFTHHRVLKNGGACSTWNLTEAKTGLSIVKGRATRMEAITFGQERILIAGKTEFRKRLGWYPPIKSRKLIK